MRYVTDLTGQLEKRPHFAREELDELFQELGFKFLLETRGEIKFPITDEQLERLAESKTDDFDSFADLSAEGQNIDGVTIFYRDALPTIKISAKLDGPLLNRRRTTIAHEIAHVILHSSLWDPSVLGSQSDKNSRTIRCKRSDIQKAHEKNWLEWQANYGSGALLMPKGEVLKIQTDVWEFLQLDGAVRLGSNASDFMLSKIKRSFGVSMPAAKVRLLQLGILVEAEIEGYPAY